MQPNTRLVIQSLLLVAGFFFSFVWDQNFNLISGAICLALITLAAGLADLQRFFSSGLWRNPYASWITGLALAMLVWIWVRSIWSDVPSTSLLSAGFYCLPFLVFCFAVAQPNVLPSKVGLIGIGILLAVVGTIATFTAIYGDVTGNYFGNSPRSDWPMQSANHLAMIMNAGILFSIGLIAHPTWRRWGWGLLILCVLASMSTGSRAGNLTLAIGLSVMTLILWPLWAAQWRRTLIAAGAVLGLALLFVLVRSATVNMAGAYEGLFENVTTSSGGRPLMWAAIFHLALERPWRGYGVGTFLFVYPQVMSFAAHNDWLHMFLETGAIGAALYASLGLAVVGTSIAIRRINMTADQRIIWATCLGVMTTLILHSQIEFMMLVIPILILFGLALGVYTRTLLSLSEGRPKKEEKQKPPYVTGMALSLVLIFSSLVSLMHTYAQVKADEAGRALMQNDLRSFARDLDISSALSMDQQAAPYLRLAQYQLSAFLNGQRDDSSGPAKVQDSINKALVRNPYLSSIYDLQGRLDHVLGKSPEESWRKGLRYEPRSADLRANLILFYEKMGRRTDARAMADDTWAWQIFLRGRVNDLSDIMSRYPKQTP